MVLYWWNCRLGGWHTIFCITNNRLLRRHKLIWARATGCHFFLFSFFFFFFFFLGGGGWTPTVKQTTTRWYRGVLIGRFEWKFRQVIFKLISVINSWGVLCEMIPKRMWLDLTDDKSTLVQVMSHYLSQCWPISLSPYGVTRPQWVKVKIRF